MTAWPRTITPFEVSEFSLPGPLISKSQGGKVQVRSNLQIGRTWRESYLLKMSDTSHKGFLATVRNYWRNGQIFTVQHVDHTTLMGAGGGSPVVNAATQLATLPENFDGWVDIGTPVLTAGQSDPLGGTAAYLISDNDAAAFEGLYLEVDYTGDAAKAVSVYLKQGTATVNTLALRTNTGPVYRAIVQVTWTAGVPALAVTSGSATLYTVEQHPTQTDWYRCSFAPAGVVGTEVNRIEVYPTTSTAADTGTVYAFGANTWDEVSPARYSGPSQPNNDATGNLLHMNGGTASVSNYFRAGDLISVPVGSLNYVLEVGADVSTQANGYAAVPITPPLFTGGAPSDNAAISTSNVQMRCILLEPPSWPESSGSSADYGELSVIFGEAL